MAQTTPIRRHHVTGYAEFTEVYKESLVHCALAPSLVPVFVTWILFSTADFRRQPVFYIQLLAVAMALSFAALVLSLIAGSAGMSQRTVDAMWASASFLCWTTPIVTDTALTIRLLAFYPPKFATRCKRLAIILFPTLCRLLRSALTAAILGLQAQHKSYHKFKPPEKSLAMTEYALELADNSYTSIVILSRIYQVFRDKGLFASRPALSKNAGRFLFEAFTISFVPATILQAALVALMVREFKHQDVGQFRVYAIHIQFANVYVSLQLSLLATSWSAMRKYSIATLAGPQQSDEIRKFVVKKEEAKPALNEE